MDIFCDRCYFPWSPELGRVIIFLREMFKKERSQMDPLICENANKFGGDEHQSLLLNGMSTEVIKHSNTPAENQTKSYFAHPDHSGFICSHSGRLTDAKL